MPRRRAALPPPYLRTLAFDPARARPGHPFDLPWVRSLDLAFTHPITVLIGDNGSGKSTLLEAIAELAGFPPDGGSRSHRGVTADDDRRLAEELDREQPGQGEVVAEVRRDERLTRALRASWLPKPTDGFFFRAETFFSLARWLDARAIGVGSGPGHLRRSHGEGFLDFFEDRLDRAARGGRPSLFVFDEPEAALSPRRQLGFLRWLQRVDDGGRAQVVLATHSPLVMACPGAALWALGRDGIAPVRLEDVDAFRVLASFAEDPHRYVARALRDEA